MSDLGFNPENVIPAIEPTMILTVQANTPLTIQDLRNTLSTMEMIEAIDMVREVVLNSVTLEQVQLDRGLEVTIGNGKRYRKDKNYSAFWAAVARETEEALYHHFVRTVHLNTGIKVSTHPAIRRLTKLIIHPILSEFARCTPSSIRECLDSTKVGLESEDVFGNVSRFLAYAPIELHADNVLVARKLLERKCSVHGQKVNRLLTIKNAAEKVQQDKYD